MPQVSSVVSCGSRGASEICTRLSARERQTEAADNQQNLPVISALNAAAAQGAGDLCHYGAPDDRWPCGTHAASAIMAGIGGENVMNTGRLSVPPSLGNIARYSFAIGSVLLAMGAMALLRAIGVPSPRFPFYLAVAATGWFTGDAPAAVAVGLSALGLECVPVAPVQNLTTAIPQPSFLFFVASTVLTGAAAVWAANSTRPHTRQIRKPLALEEYRRIEAIQPEGGVLITRLNASPGTGARQIPLPKALIQHGLRGIPEDFYALQMEGPGIAPIAESGDWVLADRRRTVPTEPGFFIVEESIGAVVQWIEPIPLSNPASYRVRLGCSRAVSYEIHADDVRIIGRVVWAGHRL